MKRVRYYNDTMPGAEQLNFGEQASGEALLERFRAITVSGVKAGFLVTPNPQDPTRVDISAGEGYTPSGERIYSDVPTSGGVALASYSDKTQNYIVLKYEEVGSSPLEERFGDKRKFNTIYEDSFSIEVFTSDEWFALSTSELENRLLIAVVTANGEGQPITNDSIQSPTDMKSPLTATQPEISGITLLYVSPYTRAGTGLLEYTIDKGIVKISWRAPFDDGSGDPVEVRESGTYIVYSYTPLNYIKIDVNLGVAPAENTSASVYIKDLYSQLLPAMTSVDRYHRSMIGSGVPTSNNPHGLTWDDIQGAGESEVTTHQDKQHSNGIWSGSNSDCLKVSIQGGPTDKLNIKNPAEGDCFYIKGKRHESILNNTIYTFDIGNITADAVLYDIYVDSYTNVKAHMRAYTSLPSSDILTGVYIAGVPDGFGEGGYTIEFNIDNEGKRKLQISGYPSICPWSSGIYALPCEESFILVGVKSSGLPGGTGASYTLSLSVLKGLDKDSTMKIASVTYFPGGADLEYLRDLRKFGNIGDENIRTDHGASPGELLKELRSAGVISGLSVRKTGEHTVSWDYGVVYLQGCRMEIGNDSLTVPSNSNAVFYACVSVGKDVVLLEEREDVDIPENLYVKLAKIKTDNYGKIDSITDIRIQLSDLDLRLREASSDHSGAQDIGYYNSDYPALENVRDTLDYLFSYGGTVVRATEWIRTGAQVYTGSETSLSVSPGTFRTSDGCFKNSTELSVNILQQQVLEEGTTLTANTVYYCYGVPLKEKTSTNEWSVRISENPPGWDKLYTFSDLPDNYASRIGRYLGAIRTEKNSSNIVRFKRTGGVLTHKSLKVVDVSFETSTFKQAVSENVLGGVDVRKFSKNASDPFQQLVLPKTAKFLGITGSVRVSINVDDASSVIRTFRLIWTPESPSSPFDEENFVVHCMSGRSAGTSIYLDDGTGFNGWIPLGTSGDDVYYYIANVSSAINDKLTTICAFVYKYTGWIEEVD